MLYLESLKDRVRRGWMQSNLVRRYTKKKAYFLSYSNRLYPLRYRLEMRSPLTNIYHCCTQKTASQWFRNIFHDPVFYKHTGLVSRPYIEMGLRSASFNRPWPKRAIATHLYVGYSAYSMIPKPQQYKTFFVVRDPRDIVVSWYFSAKNSHVLIEPVPTMRVALESLELKDGLVYIIDCLKEFGSFEAQRSWLNCPNEGGRIRIFRYEDLANNDVLFLKSLFEHLEIALPEEEVSALAARHTFLQLSGGRYQGEEDLNSHYRKGQAGDWKNYFDDDLTAYFREVTGDLIEELGYSA